MQRCGSRSAAFRQPLIRTLPPMKTNNENGGLDAGRRAKDWRAAFLSGDPAMQWAAACSVAQAAVRGDRWVDSTALHEARFGAYETAVIAVDLDPEAVVPAAIAGARRALYWERSARRQLIPPASLGARQWRTRPARSDMTRLVPLSPAVIAEASDVTVLAPASTVCAPSILDVIAERLVDRGWSWPVPAAQAVEDAVQAVLVAGRDRASASLADIDHDLPPVVAEGLVMLVAGSRMRASRPWPGLVWLAKHRGVDTAFDDPGAHNVLDAVVSGRSARPARAAGAAVINIGRKRRRARSLAAGEGGRSTAARRPEHQEAVRDGVAS